MGERKKGISRFLSCLMAVVMAFTMVWASGIGTNVVKAEENKTFTLYYYSEDSTPPYVNIWNWAGISLGEAAVKDNSWGWNHEQAIMQSVPNNDNWYYTVLDIKDAAANDGFTIYQGGSTDSDKKIEYDNQWNHSEDYKTMVSGSYDAYAVKDSTFYTDLQAAGLMIGSASGDEDNITIAASAKKVEAGNAVELTASVRYNGELITDLDAAGYKMSWWADSWNDHQDGKADAVIDESSKNTMKTSVQLPSVGTYYIVCDLYEVVDEKWNKLLSNCVTLTSTEPENAGTVEGDLNITKVKELSNDFIMGMDISSVISEFASGVTYKGFDGKIIDNVTDFCKFLASQGITCIRVRVWNNPYDASGNGYGGGNNDVEKAKTMADACRAAGIKMLVDFHCSDLWTDPGKQQVPKAWKNYSLEEKESALQQFLTDSLNTIDPAKDTVTMVQVGNETTNGFIGETDITNMCKLFSAGAAGVRAYNGEVKVVIHETNPEKGNVTKWAKNLSDNSVNYDVLATSYYPYWHGTLDNLKSEFAKVKEDYGKDVMVAETSYAYTLNDSDGHDNTVRVGNNDTGENTTEPFNEQGQATAIRNLIEAVNSVGGLGVFYWEPAWITVGDTTGLTGAAYEEQVAKNKAVWEKYGSGWASSFANEYDSEDAGKWYGGSAVDNEAMFYPDGTPTPGLHVWNYVKTGSKTNDVYLYSVGKAEELNQTIKVGENADIPETVTVTYSTGEVQEPVTWNAEELGKIDQNKPGVYEVSGVVNLTKEITQGLNKGQKQAEVTYKLTVKQANLITDAEDAGFEKGENFEVSGSGISDIPAKDDPYEGSHSMHWYSADAAAGTVTYNKEITLESGKYNFEAVAQGEGTGISLNILDQSGKVLFEGEQTKLNGWRNWMIPQVRFSLSQKAVIKLQIQVDMAAKGWGTADSLYLYKTGEAEKPDSGNEGSSGNSGGTYIPSLPGSPNTPTAPTTPATPEKPTTPATPSTGDTTITKNPDDTTTETKTEITTNESGKEVEVTVTTEKDAAGNVTGSKEVSVIAEAGKNTSATVTVAKDADGKVTDVKAQVTQNGTGSKTNVTTTISGDVVSQIAKAADTDSVAIKVTVTDSMGNTKYTVSADSKDVTAGNKLKVVAVDKKTGKYKLVNGKTYQVAEDGSVKVSLPKGADYALLSTKEAKTVEKAILKTVAPKKSTASVKKGKSTNLQMSSKLDMDNVKNITYSTSKKSVASISKNGKITAKKKGTVVVKAKVALKNGTTKTVSMKIKVK